MRFGLRIGLGLITIWMPLRRYRRAKYWHHGTCPIRHRYRHIADACRNRRRRRVAHANILMGSCGENQRTDVRINLAMQLHWKDHLR